MLAKVLHFASVLDVATRGCLWECQ